jgi:hypothetical protein
MQVCGPNRATQCSQPRKRHALPRRGAFSFPVVIFGLGTDFEDAAAGSGFTPDAARNLHAKLSPALFELLFVEAMPIRDAVDLARFLVETTIGFVKFSIARPKTVGGSIAIAAITKHEGFQWVQRQNGFGAGRTRGARSSRGPFGREQVFDHVFS